jgi:hypothetical protein
MPIPDRSHQPSGHQTGLNSGQTDRIDRSEEHMAPHPHTDPTATESGRPRLAEAPRVDLTTAYNDALAWWDAYDALVDLDLGTTVEDVIATAHRLGIDNVRDLHRRAAEIIQQVSDEDSITRFTDFAVAERLHRCRNAIAALVLATTALHVRDGHGPYDLIETLPRIAPRHGDKCRPGTDDEVLLARSASIHSLMRGGRYIRVATQYALAESGAHPIETTAIRPTDFDSIHAPTTVRLPGDTWYHPRRVALTPFARRVLGEGLDAHLAADPGAHQSRLCFQGTSKASASASSSNNLKNIATRVGITAPRLEGSFATRWRAHKELRDHGVMSALYLIGKNHAEGPEKDEPRRVYEFLNLPPKAQAIEIDDEDDEDDDDLRFCG